MAGRRKGSLYITRQLLSQKSGQNDSAQRATFKQLELKVVAHGFENKKNDLWFSRAKFYVRHRVYGSPLGRMTIEPETRQLIDEWYRLIAEQTGYAGSRRDNDKQ